MAERITSRTNPRVQRLRALLAKRQGDEVGLEGFHLVREAVASGLQLTSLYLRDDVSFASLNLPPDAAREVVVLSSAAFQSAAVTESSQGVAAIVRRPTMQYVPRTGDLLLVADAIQDPGNLGTLVRSAEAFGASAVALTPGTVDPWNGKCLRAAAGALFRLPLLRWDDDLLGALKALGAQVFASVVDGGLPAHQADFRDTVAVIVGNEGAGVSEPMLALADHRITLATTGPTESLNAAVAGSLLLYEASQQRYFR